MNDNQHGYSSDEDNAEKPYSNTLSRQYKRETKKMKKVKKITLGQKKAETKTSTMS